MRQEYTDLRNQKRLTSNGGSERGYRSFSDNTSLESLLMKKLALHVRECRHRFSMLKGAMRCHHRNDFDLLPL